MAGEFDNPFAEKPNSDQFDSSLQNQEQKRIRVPERTRRMGAYLAAAGFFLASVGGIIIGITSKDGTFTVGNRQPGQPVIITPTMTATPDFLTGQAALLLTPVDETPTPEDVIGGNGGPDPDDEGTKEPTDEPLPTNTNTPTEPPTITPDMVATQATVKACIDSLRESLDLNRAGNGTFNGMDIQPQAIMPSFNDVYNYAVRTGQNDVLAMRMNVLGHMLSFLGNENGNLHDTLSEQDSLLQRLCDDREITYRDFITGEEQTIIGGREGYSLTTDTRGPIENGYERYYGISDETTLAQIHLSGLILSLAQSNAGNFDVTTETLIESGVDIDRLTNLGTIRIGLPPARMMSNEAAGINPVFTNDDYGYLTIDFDRSSGSLVLHVTENNDLRTIYNRYQEETRGGNRVTALFRRLTRVVGWFLNGGNSTSYAGGTYNGDTVVISFRDREGRVISELRLTGDTLNPFLQETQNVPLPTATSIPQPTTEGIPPVLPTVSGQAPETQAPPFNTPVPNPTETQAPPFNTPVPNPTETQAPPFNTPVPNPTETQAPAFNTPAPTNNENNGGDDDDDNNDDDDQPIANETSAPPFNPPGS